METATIFSEINLQHVLKTDRERNNRQENGKVYIKFFILVYVLSLVNPLVLALQEKCPYSELF